MKTKAEALENNLQKVSVTVDAADVDARIAKTYKQFAHKYNFPGFRKGKAPRPVIDNALGKEAVRATVTDELINEAVPTAIDECGLFPASNQPDFEGTDKLVEAGKDFSFTFTIAVKPEYELTNYKPVEIELPAEEVTDAEVKEQIDMMREHYADYEDASAATKVKADSMVDISIKATGDDGKELTSICTEDRPYTLGGGLYPEDFDKNLVGLKKGDSKQFTIDMPAQPTLMLSSIAGQTSKINFDVEVKSVKKKVLPELNDAWAKDIMGFDNMDDMTERVKESIKVQKESATPRIKEQACLEEIAKRLKGEVPENLVAQNETQLIQDFFRQLQAQGMTFDVYLQQMGMNSEQFRDDVKKQAEDMTKQDLALDAWARHAKLEATDVDIEMEFIKSGVDDPKALQEEWRKNGQMYMVREGVLRAKAVTDLMDSAKVTELPFEEYKAKQEKKQAEAEKEAAAKKPTAKKTAEKKPAAKKPAAKTEAAEEAKPAAKKAATAKKATTAKKPAAKKPAAKDNAAE